MFLCSSRLASLLELFIRLAVKKLFANVSFLSVILVKIIPNCFLFSVIAMVDNGTKKDFAGEEFASPGITRAKTTLLNRLFYSDTGGVLTGVLFVVTKLFFLFSALLVVAAVLGFVGVYLRKAYFLTASIL